jgi:hypothetical protein
MQKDLPQRDVENELALAIVHGGAALWIGPDWRWGGTPDERRLAVHNWLGFWAEPRDPATARFLSQAWEGRPFRRTFVEVPGQLQEALDRDFSYARRCPYFYLAGRGPDAVETSPRRRQFLRASHVEEIERLGNVTLVVAGIHDLGHLVEVLKEDLENSIDRLQRLIITGIQDTQALREALAAMGEAVNTKVGLIEAPLPALLARMSASREVTVHDPREQLRVGKDKLPLRGLLHTVPPIDQYFYIVTEYDLRPPEPEEAQHATKLLTQLLCGQDPPWRAFRHQLEWKRAIGAKLEKHVFETLQQMRSPAAPTVRCLNLVAEPGSGLTTLLQSLAFHIAERGFPALMARDSSQTRFQFDVLRAFLFDLDHQTAAMGEPGIPVVLLLDAAATRRDPNNTFKDLPRRLRAHNRRVLIIRGAHDMGDLPTPLAMDMGEPAELLSVLRPDEHLALKDWVQKTCARFYPDQKDAKVKRVEEWAAENEEGTQGISLLVGLYYLLTEDLRRAADLGRHLLRDLGHQMDILASQQKQFPPAKSLHVQVAEGTIEKLTFGHGRVLPNRLPLQLVEAVTLTAAMACLDKFLGEFAPISVIGKVINADTTDTYRTLNRLEEAHLIKADALAKYNASGRRLMPVTYYEDWETAAMIHPGYGPMVLDSIATDQRQLGQLVKESPLCQEILKVYEYTKVNDDCRFQFLRPLFAVLEPGIAPHRWFAEYISMQHLRPQRHYEFDDTTAVSRDLLQGILEAFDWLNPVLIETSGPLLHSRALSRSYAGFKLDDDALENSRALFRKAIDDIDLAIEVESERPAGEDLGNLRTTCGHIHLKWAIRELRCPDGNQVEWNERIQRAKEQFEHAYDLRQNSYPAHALANLILHELEYQTGKRDLPPGKESWIPPHTPTDFARNLTKVMELLSIEPELWYHATWNHNRARAVRLLNDHDAIQCISELKQNGDDMGYALDALRILEEIPRSPIARGDQEQVDKLNRASLVLAEAENEGVAPCALGNLLRYAIFSARPERALTRGSRTAGTAVGNECYAPAYKERYKLMQRLLDIEPSYLRDPIWRYDAAMLCFQNRKISEGSRHFADLRKASRFRNVPQERTVPWVISVDDPRELKTELRITRIEKGEDRGWGRLVKTELGYVEEIPFRLSFFTARGEYKTEELQTGRRIDVVISLRPAGPHAVPPPQD